VEQGQLALTVAMQVKTEKRRGSSQGSSNGFLSPVCACPASPSRAQGGGWSSGGYRPTGGVSPSLPLLRPRRAPDRGPALASGAGEPHCSQSPRGRPWRGQPRAAGGELPGRWPECPISARTSSVSARAQPPRGRHTGWLLQPPMASGSSARPELESLCLRTYRRHLSLRSGLGFCFGSEQSFAERGSCSDNRWIKTPIAMAPEERFQGWPRRP